MTPGPRRWASRAGRDLDPEHDHGAPGRMGAVRPFLVLFLLACALGGLVWTLRDTGAGQGTASAGGPLTAPVDEPTVAPDAAPVDLEPRAGATLEAGAPQYTPRVLDTPLLPPMRGDPMALVADVYLQLESDELLPGVSGHVRIRQFAGGEFEELVVPVVAGRLTCTVPERSLLTVLDGELKGEEVRFAGLTRAFEPRPARMALIGRARPSYTLRVVAAGTGADLTDLTLREVDGPGGAHLVAGPSTGAGEARPEPRDPLSTGAVSPLRVPWVDTKRPVWLEVSAPGYAPARALVDPRVSGERSFELYPAAGTLTVHVTGPGRGRVEGLVLQRLEAEDRRPVAAHFTSAPAGSEARDPLVFEVAGLAAARHLVRATYFDRWRAGGTIQDLASGEVDLLVGADARLDLFVP